MGTILFFTFIVSVIGLWLWGNNEVMDELMEDVDNIFYNDMSK